MSIVYFSAKNAFEERLKDITSAVSNPSGKAAIYGTGTRNLSIIVNDNGIRPVCSSGLINESEETDGLTIRDGNVKIRSYNVNENNILESMKNATRDELDLFISLADPNTLNNLQIQSSFFGRLHEIQQQDIFNAAVQNKSDEGLEALHMEETVQYADFYLKLEGAVEVPEHHAFYPQGYGKEQIDTAPVQ